MSLCTELEPVAIAMCDTAVSDGRSSLIDTLVRLRGGICCFVTSLGPLPVWGAAEFARRFFAALLGNGHGPGISMGAALGVARRGMLDELNSPLGLLVSGWGYYNTRLAVSSPLQPFAGATAINQGLKPP